MRSKQALAARLTHLKNLQFSPKYSIILDILIQDILAKYISSYQYQRSLTGASYKKHEYPRIPSQTNSRILRG